MRTNGPPPPVGHVTVGQIVAPHGILGGVRVECMTDFPERFSRGNRLFVGGVEMRVKSVSWHKGQARVVFEDINTVEAAEALKWAYITVPSTDRPKLGKGEFVATDLLGLDAFDQNGEFLGKVDDVLPSPAHSLLVVSGALVPAVKDFVREVDLTTKRIVIHVIPGLFEEEAP